MPDLTPAQLVAIAGAAIALAVSFGAPISEDQRFAILTFVGALASVLMGADAKIRHGRSTGKPPRPLPPAPAHDEPADDGEPH